MEKDRLEKENKVFKKSMDDFKRENLELSVVINLDK